MPPAGFEPAIPECEQPQIQALDRAATGIGLAIIITIMMVGGGGDDDDNDK